MIRCVRIAKVEFVNVNSQSESKSCSAALCIDQQFFSAHVIITETYRNCFTDQQLTSYYQMPSEFIAESFADLMFLRLPSAHNQTPKIYLGQSSWREEWLRGGDDFWTDFQRTQANRLGTSVETKSQYLRLLEETLITAKHIETWAIAHVENGFISTQEIIETIGRIRRVDTIFTKDFSELTGTKAVIITA